MPTADLSPGAEILLRALKEQGVEVIFGYPGGAVLPIYDAIFNQNAIRHILAEGSSAPARLTAPPSGLFLERVYYEGDRQGAPPRAATPLIASAARSR